jgi:Uma2 family endonuclease
METALSTYRFSVEFNKLGEAGIFDEDDRVELIDGEIIIISPVGSRHAGTAMQIAHEFQRKFGDQVLLNMNSPAVLDDFSGPLPDVSALKPRKDFYKSAHPRPDDIFLIIEVSDPTLAYDRGPKLQKYAERGINEVWVVNVKEPSIEQFREPTPREFRGSNKYRIGDQIELEAFPEIRFQVEELIG